MQVRKLNDCEISGALKLVWDVFLQYDACYYSSEGVEHFRQCVHDPLFMAQLAFYGACEGDELAGVLATRSNGGHIALFFVDGKHHRKGIGRKLFAEALKNSPSNTMTVHSSPYAVDIYKKLGFIATNTEQTENGIRYTPMRYFTKAE